MVLPPPPRRPRRLAPLALAASLLGAPAVAAAAGPLAIAPVRNDVRGQLTAQLVGALCEGGRCLPGAGGLDGPRPDLARARRRGAGAALLGSVWRERGGLVLSLALFTEGSRPARTWVLPLGGDRRLAPAQVARLRAEVEEVAGRGAAGANRTATATPTPTATATATPTPTPTATAPALHTAAPLTLPVPPRPRPPSPTPPWAALEAGVAPARQTLRYPGGGTSPVGYAVTLPAQPRLRLELWPFAPGGGPLSGAGLFAEGAWLGAITLPSGARTHRATAWQLRAGLAWRLPVAAWLTATPDLAWEREAFVVGPADGLKVPGLPDARLSGASGGLALEAPVGGRVALLLAGRATWWFEARELAGGASFYPGGRATGLAAEGGAAVRLAGPLSLRLVGTWARTTWSLDADPSGAFTVRSAEAERWGGRAVLRLER